MGDTDGRDLQPTLPHLLQHREEPPPCRRGRNRTAWICTQLSRITNFHRKVSLAHFSSTDPNASLLEHRVREPVYRRENDEVTVYYLYTGQTPSSNKTKQKNTLSFRTKEFSRTRNSSRWTKSSHLEPSGGEGLASAASAVAVGVCEFRGVTSRGLQVSGGSFRSRRGSRKTIRFCVSWRMDWTSCRRGRGRL